MKATSLFKEWRVWLLLTFLLFSFIAISPQFSNDGAIIIGVTPNSSASIAGISGSSSAVAPLSKEKIIRVNGASISDADDFYDATSLVVEESVVFIDTDEGSYTLIAGASGDLGLRVSDAPTSNLRKGLDLAGGTRVLLSATEPISEEDLTSTIDSLEQRLNVYGLSDVVIRSARDLDGKDFILIEIAGVSEEEVAQLISEQGRFEATIGGEVAFSGGEKDVTFVCRSASCSGIDSQRGCGQQTDGSYACGFAFSITLSPNAAERQAGLTRDLDVVSYAGSSYLSEDLVLFLDDQQVDSLRIGASLRGRAETEIQISGSGSGLTQEDAVENALAEMRRLQTVIITGSLPVDLEVVKLDSISASLGSEFLRNVMLVGALALLSVILVVSVRYRSPKVTVPLVLTFLSELVLILGFAAFVGWNLDLAAIAGIIIAVGTGVDDLIIITDSTLRGTSERSLKRGLKLAMFIVIGAYVTTLAGMLPLLWAGAGIVKGFALTTIAGVSFGVLVSRPAYAAVLRRLLS